MIPMSLTEIARVVGGRAVQGDVLVRAPASIDSRQISAGGLFVAIAGANVDGHDFVQAAFENKSAAALVSKPVDGPHVLVDDVVQALGTLAAHVCAKLQSSGLKVIGITGSQGKTTTKDLLSAVLAGAGPTVAPTNSFNNEIGVPLTILRADEQTRYLIVEMGARGIGHITQLAQIAQPTIGAVLNVGHAHAGEFQTIKQTAIAKGELFLAIPKEGFAVVNGDDPLVREMPTAAHRIFFGAGREVRATNVELNDFAEPSFALSIGDEVGEVSLSMSGEHNVMNALAAAAIAHACGLSLEMITSGLNSFTPLSAMRMERSTRTDGLLVVNDAYNANPESMKAAINALKEMACQGRRIMVVGTMGELGEQSAQLHSEIGKYASERSVDVLVAIGEFADQYALGFGSETQTFDDVTAAVAFIEHLAKPDDVILIKASRSAGLERVARGLLNK